MKTKARLGCGIEFPHFGADYPDAQCIDGYLWNIDSYDNGFLTIGGDDACPVCNTEKWLEQIEIGEDGDFETKEDALRYVELLKQKYGDNHMSKIDYIKGLGWVYQTHENNRAIYELGKDSVCTYSLFEHRGDIGVLHDGIFNYYNLNEHDINKFTDILQERIEMMHNSKDYTLYQAQMNSGAILSLLDEFSKKRKSHE